jgi:hypothetical protein
VCLPAIADACLDLSSAAIADEHARYDGEEDDLRSTLVK